MRHKRLQIIAEMALAIALAAVLNSLRIWRMPNAGTVSFVMLPIIVLSLRRGLWVGLITGALYGVVDFFIDPFPPVVWIQPLLDYPIAYAMVGLAGLFSPLWHSAMVRKKALQASAWVVAAALVGGLGRYLVHTASGAIFFAEYAPKGQPAIVYSAIYNLYVPLSVILASVGAIALLPPLEKAVPSGERA